MRVALVLLLFALAACSTGGGPPRRSPDAVPASAPATATPVPSASPSPTGDAPAVTPEDAAVIARKVLGAEDAARAWGAESYAVDLTRDAQRLFTVTAFKSTRMKPARYTWGAPRVLVPRLGRDRYPYWFAAVADRRDAQGRDRTALLVFMKEYPTSLWQLGFASLLYPGTKPPAVLLDREGYATALPTRDDSIAISPHLMAPLHATIAEEGPGGFAAGLIAAGPQTTGYFTEVGKEQPEAKGRGLLYDSIFAATTFPIFALRTTDGGGVIMYSLTRTTLRQVKTDNALGLVPVPRNVRWATGDRPVVRRKLRVEETQQYVTQVSRKGATTPAKVMGFDGTPTSVTSDMPIEE
ncbi:hypothetical protein DQ384_13990 [Sphaerisporangium album]|uniref:DUF8094 domain-containing protein n=2 Tax=Sphaerisporangium album TaxID=509200 RepID=A0A367FKX9_9ACTN|nr:hypothetical protein DQ384_13990 [Sphaerisporangium album]